MPASLTTNLKLQRLQVSFISLLITPFRTKWLNVSSIIVPWKAIYLATALLLLGSMFIILGVLIKVGIITSEVSSRGFFLYRYMHLQKVLKLTWLAHTDMAWQRHSIPGLRLYHVYPRRLPLLCSLLCLLSLSWIRLFHDSRHGLTNL